MLVLSILTIERYSMHVITSFLIQLFHISSRKYFFFFLLIVVEMRKTSYYYSPQSVLLMFCVPRGNESKTQEEREEKESMKRGRENIKREGEREPDVRNAKFVT